MTYSALLMAFALQTTPNAVETVLDCGRIQLAEARLACYDAVRDSIERSRAEGGAADALASSLQPTPDQPVSSAGAAEDRRGADGFGIPRVSVPSFSLPSAPNVFEAEGNAAGEEADVRIVERFANGDPELVIMNIVGVREIGFQKYRFTMENGQIWEQTSSQRARIPEAGDSAQAHIRRTRMGAHLLRINGDGTNLRVRRVE